MFGRDGPEPAAWKSSNAWMISALVFITNGPYIATGSRIGRPPSRNTSSDAVRESWVAAAVNVTLSPLGPNTAVCPARIGARSAPTVPSPAST